MLYTKNAAGVVEEYDWHIVESDDEHTSFASEAYLNGENDEDSCVLNTANEGTEWWTD